MRRRITAAGSLQHMIEQDAGQAQVRVLGVADGHPELMSLREWISNESELRGRVRVDEPEPADGQMGGLAEVLTVALASGGALTVLASSVSVWLQQRRSEISVEIVRPDGSLTRVTASGPAADDVASKLD